MTDENDEVRQFVESILSTNEALSHAERLGFDELTPEAYRSVALDMADSRIQNRVECGSNRVSAVENAIEDLPDSLTDSVIQSERSIIPYDGSFRNLQDNLRLEQLAEKSGRNTHESRKELWDRLLAFSHYQVTIEAENPDGGTETIERECMAESNAKAQNKTLRKFRRRNSEYEVESLNTKVRNLAFPEIDPLPDLEEFVYRF